MVETRSRRCCGERALKLFGMRSRSIAVTGTGKSAGESRLTCRPAVSTRGSGSLAPGGAAWPWPVRPGSRTSARPAAPARDQDDVPPAELFQGLPGLRPAVRRAFPGCVGLAQGQFLAQRVVFGVVTKLARGTELGQGGPAPAGLPRPARPPPGPPGTGRTRIPAARPPCPGPPARPGSPPCCTRAGSWSSAGRSGYRPGLPTASGSTPGCQSTTACPSTSMPRRPARPVSCVSPRGQVRVSLTIPLVQSFNYDGPGRMLIPRASVSVAKTARTRPASKSSSTTSLKVGSIPAWCAATPRCRPVSHSR